MVTVNPNPFVDLGPDIGICDGNCTPLSAFGGVTYLWSNSATTASIDACPINTTTYTVTVTDVNGCTGSDDVIVFIVPGPVFTLTPDGTICEGDCKYLELDGGDDYTYMWSFGSTAISETVCPTTTTTYTVTATDGYGCTATKEVTVTVSPTPSADAGPDVSVCSGACTMLTATGGVSYIWSEGSTDVSIDVCPLIETTYTVTVTDINGCTASDEVVVTVNPDPNADAGTDVTICSNECTTLTASGGVNYLWNAGGTDASFDVCPASTTTYTVVVADINGCTASDNVTVTVMDKPTIFNVILPPSGGGYCDGGSGVDVCLDGWEAGVEYELYFDGNPTGLVTGGAAGGFCIAIPG